MVVSEREEVLPDQRGFYSRFDEHAMRRASKAYRSQRGTGTGINSVSSCGS